MRLLFSVGGYLATLVFIVIGGTYGIRASLATVPMPDFLVPEYSTKPSIVPRTTANDVRVQLKPYNPVKAAGTSWRPSLVQGYVGKSAVTNQSGRPKGSDHDSKKAKRAFDKKRHEAMGAYASGRRQHR